VNWEQIAVSIPRRKWGLRVVRIEQEAPAKTAALSPRRWRLRAAAGILAALGVTWLACPLAAYLALGVLLAGVYLLARAV
jgi:hypothetical protein